MIPQAACIQSHRYTIVHTSSYRRPRQEQSVHPGEEATNTYTVIARKYQPSALCAPTSLSSLDRAPVNHDKTNINIMSTRIAPNRSLQTHAGIHTQTHSGIHTHRNTETQTRDSLLRQVFPDGGKHLPLHLAPLGFGQRPLVATIPLLPKRRRYRIPHVRPSRANGLRNQILQHTSIATEAGRQIKKKKAKIRQ